MNISYKSLAFAAISNYLSVYFNDEEDSLVVSKLVCTECGENWYTNLNECFLCGTLNPFLHICRECGVLTSITSSSKHCSNCKKETRKVLGCINSECLSNKKEYSGQIDNKGGVFDKESGFSLSQQYCLKCGSQLNNYKTRKIYIFDPEDGGALGVEIDKGNYVVFRKKEKAGISYYYALSTCLDGTENLSLNKMKKADNVKDLFNGLFDGE